MNVKKALNNLFNSSQFVVEDKTWSTGSISATSSSTNTINVKKTGYKFIGVVGYRIEQVSGSNGRVNIKRLSDLLSDRGCAYAN